ncbi:DUF2164 domain-containing protein [Saccharibacillus sp. CPCC 101409]|uniref:DUF2164 domain-containing protein n=1 Tax=Saccharibacillus sp. CPCC 101409 TaxID=3058041 RepID=UPI0026734C91|nr:DUF2164 domain-containing protein [Saccharibacillus sp. CPCC 101409]MDO3410870.1 DUF2164 domain-containing protein [Saccharibacillus sp. CPCC 101409]
MIPIKLPREQKLELIEDLQAFFYEERSEEIGEIAAEQLLDHMLQRLGPYVYNQAVRDAKAAVNEKIAQIEDELYALERPLERR